MYDLPLVAIAPAAVLALLLFLSLAWFLRRRRAKSVPPPEDSSAARSDTAAEAESAAAAETAPEASTEAPSTVAALAPESLEVRAPPVRTEHAPSDDRPDNTKEAIAAATKDGTHRADTESEKGSEATDPPMEDVLEDTAPRVDTPMGGPPAFPDQAASRAGEDEAMKDPAPVAAEAPAEPAVSVSVEERDERPARAERTDVQGTGNEAAAHAPPAANVEDAREESAPAREGTAAARSIKPDPHFEALLAAFEEELRQGHFSRQDVYAEHAEAASVPGARKVTRSRYFHEVVNKALEIRDELEGLLHEDDRKRFVDVHSHYLDEVTDEPDAEARRALLRDHLDLLPSLRPRPAEEPEQA